MIAYLNGNILHKDEKYLILEVNGVGYQVFTTSTVISDIEDKDALELFIHTHVREDDITLYGFPTLAELKFFKLLISVSGIGPKMGMEILSAPVAMVKNAIFTEDTAFLTKINGLGKKTAERLVLELKNKVEPAFTEVGREAQGISRNIDEDAVTALQSLGYSKYQILRVLKDIDTKKNVDVKFEKTEDVIKYFLQNV